MKTAYIYYCCIGSLIALIFLGLAWELWLAPLRPGGSFMALKILPLLTILPGILRGRIYVYQCATMLVLFYFAEGIVRGYADTGMSSALACAEIVLSLVYFAASIGYVRNVRKS